MATLSLVQEVALMRMGHIMTNINVQLISLVLHDEIIE